MTTITQEPFLHRKEIKPVYPDSVCQLFYSGRDCMNQYVRIQSSDLNPGRLWLFSHELSTEQVKELIPLLEEFVATGKLS